MPQESFTRPVTVDPWPSLGIELTLEASRQECRALAERFGLVALESFAGRARVERRGKAELRLQGQLEARVVQSCVVSLDDVPSTVEEQFECRFLQPGGDLPDDVGWDDDAELLAGSELDVGEVFAQQLALALDPYPRATDADALVSSEQAHNMGSGQDEPQSALARAMMDKIKGAARAAPARQGRD